VEPRPEWRIRKEADLAALPEKDKRSLLVSLADKTHNARAISLDLRKHGDDLWSRFNGGREDTIWYDARSLASSAGSTQEFLWRSSESRFPALQIRARPIDLYSDPRCSGRAKDKTTDET
jgi:hypothetical protein